MWASRSQWPKPSTPSTPTSTRSPLEPGPSTSRGRSGQGATSPLPLPLPLPTATRPPTTHYAPGQGEQGEPRGNWAGGKGTTRKVTGQGRSRSLKRMHSAEGGKGKDKRERIIVVVRSSCQENYPADAHTRRTSQCWSRQTRHVHALGPAAAFAARGRGGGAAPHGVVRSIRGSRRGRGMRGAQGDAHTAGEGAGVPGDDSTGGIRKGKCRHLQES